MNKIYLFKSDLGNYSSFIENYSDNEESIMGRSMGKLWQPFGDEYKPITLELMRSDTGKKNYHFDFASFLSPFFVISELALDKLNDILEPRGQILPIITGSKRKNFFGYYPTNSLPEGCLDKDKSVYRVADRGLIIRKPVLISANITDEYLFSIEEDISRVFVTDKFRQRVEDAGLLGFDFSIEIPTT